MRDLRDIFKIAVVGAGPAGLSAALRAAITHVPHVLLEKTDHLADTIFRYQLGKLIMATPVTLPMREGHLGFSEGIREAILGGWGNQAEKCALNVRYNAELKGIEGTKGNFVLTLAAGETIHATVRETKAGFRLPDDPSVPVIMIGPGTGLAPFRGFLQERAHRKAQGAKLGPAVLFFGCRHPDQDFLYADELKAFAADGITELHTAFSRGDGPKTYVQHMVAAQKDRVWSLIEQGAIVYVCGDGGKMEPDVKAALVAIYREKTGADADAGSRWIDDLGTRNRYVLDVWAGG